MLTKDLIIPLLDIYGKKRKHQDSYINIHIYVLLINYVLFIHIYS